MAIILGCNTLYPHDTILAKVQDFKLPEHKIAIDTIKSAGFSACEFSHYCHLSDDDRHIAGDYARAKGVQPWSAHAWSPVPAEADKLDAGIADLALCLQKAAQLGVSVVVVHAAQGPDPLSAGRWAVFREALTRLAPIAAKWQLRIGVENCYPREDLLGMAEVIHGLDLPEIGFVIDTGHAILRGMTPAEAIHIMGAKLFSTHLQDNHGQHDDHLPPGRGSSINWQETWQALNDVGYQGVRIVEITDCPANRPANAKQDTQDAFNFLQTFL
ncbi:MAG: sugar phosphate isomerase/epimerase [Lentisphaerae bacterium]|jgi:sugar phosphate isomerase/epimerase|nr:sugar phosphate isomerase/epimerase [Lentisphaerota bacterium]